MRVAIFGFFTGSPVAEVLAPGGTLDVSDPDDVSYVDFNKREASALADGDTWAAVSGTPSPFVLLDCKLQVVET